MNMILKLINCVILSFHVMCQNLIPTTYLTKYHASPTVIDVIDIPNGLLIGAATSSYQVEGAWNVSARQIFMRVRTEVPSLIMNLYSCTREISVEQFEAGQNRRKHGSSIKFSTKITKTEQKSFSNTNLAIIKYNIPHMEANNFANKAEGYQDYKSHNFLRRFNLTADVTTDFYHKYKEDIEMLKNFGFDSFRFSISWSRLLPHGTPDYISKDGLFFYNNILDELEGRGIEPIITIYHADHLAKFEDEGGWLNENMAYKFADYARIVFREFGDRVKYFATINEPEIYCKYYRPKKTSPYGNVPLDVSRYLCHQNMLKGHALAYHIYDKEFRHRQNGQVGIAILCDAHTSHPKDMEVLEIAHEFNCGWTANPIFSEEGDYPRIMKEKIADISTLQGLNESRLPELSDEWIKFIKNSSDFFGLNFYESHLTKQLPISEYKLWPNDEGLSYSIDPKGLRPGNEEMNIDQQGFGDVLRKIKDKYQNKPVLVLENGFPYKTDIDDDLRIRYHYLHLKELIDAITLDKCDVRMYTIWSFLDSFEWIGGYNLTYGIVKVDFDDSNLKRTPKKSALWFKEILASRQLLPPDVFNAGLNFI